MVTVLVNALEALDTLKQTELEAMKRANATPKRIDPETGKTAEYCADKLRELRKRYRYTAEAAAAMLNAHANEYAKQ